MARYIGPKLRIIRRLGKCLGLTSKKPFKLIDNKANKAYSSKISKVLLPGQHGLSKAFRGRPLNSVKAEYLIRLKVKQRLRFHYCISERYLVNLIRKTKKSKITKLHSTKKVITSYNNITKDNNNNNINKYNLLQLLEMRLDNIVFRLKMAPTIVAARQLISHGHIRVNNKKVNIPSYTCKKNDVISVANKVKSLKLVINNLNN